MKIKMTEYKIKNLKPKKRDYKVWDDLVKGLYLIVYATGGKSFRFKYYTNGKEQGDTIGKYPFIGLKTARQLCIAIKSKTSMGIDYAKEKRIQKEKNKQAQKYTLKGMCLDWLKAYEVQYPKKYKETLGRFEKHLFPHFKDRLINEIEARDLLDFFVGMNRNNIFDTAQRIHQNLVHVYQEAILKKICDSNSALVISGKLATKPEVHLPAIIDSIEFGKLLNKIDRYKYKTIQSEIGIKLMAHVFARHSELKAMRWSDIDFAKRTWTYFQTKTKTDRVVPLTGQVINLLRTAHKETRRFEFVFANPRTKTGHITTFANVFKKIIDTKIHSIHGFRASARTLLQEVLKQSPDVIEHQLGHVVPDRLGRAYNRTKHIEDRIKMMTKWSNYLGELKLEVTGVRLVK